MSSSLNRRTLLRRATSAGVALALPKWFLESSVAPVSAAEKSPNARPRIALVGCGGMGMYDTSLAVKFGDVVALCDVDSGRLGEAAKLYPKAQSFSDYRKVCDLKEVDAIITATPDHWHTLVNLPRNRQRQGCLCGEAADHDDRRREAARCCGEGE